MSGLSLLHPWLLAGLAAASLPVIIHLIGKRRAPTVFFAAFDFLMAVNKRLARRERLRQFLLLLLRTLAIVALVLAATRPVPERATVVSQGSVRVAMVIDTSASMSYRLGGETLLERAKEQARDVLSHLELGDTVALVAAGPEVRSLTRGPSADRAELRAAIDALADTGGVADLGTAMDTALSQLSSGTGPVRLVVIGDLAENSFSALRPTALDPPPDVRLIDAAEREQPVALGNVAVEAVRVEPSGGAPSERRITVMVRNYGGEPVRGRTLELVLDGEVTQRGHVEVPGRGVQEKVFTYGFSGPGAYDGEVRLAPDDADGYPRDDVALFGVEIVPGARVLAVNGDPRTTPYEDELFFVERALEAVPKGDPPINLRIVTVDELGGADLAGFDVVLLANVGALPAASVAALEELVQNGGGVLFALGDQIDFEKANDVYARLLPHPLRDVHLAADPAAGTPPLGIGGIDWDHPIIQPLGDAIEESLRASRTSRYFNLDVGAERKARVVLSFENRAPALIEARRAGKGRVMLLTTSVDLDMSDVALRSTFPALLQRTVRYLGRAVESGGRKSVRQGGDVELPLPTGAERLELTAPSGTRREAEILGTRARLTGLGEAGFYRAELVRGGKPEREPRLDVAVSASLVESDFAPVRAAQVAAALGDAERGRSVEVALGASGEKDPFELRGFASLLLLGACLFFVGESVLAARG